MKILKEFTQLFRYWKQHPIARQSLFQTVRRFIIWQIRARVLGGPFVFSWIEGSSLVIHRGMTGATMNLYCGLHEFADMGFLLHFLRPEDCFVDVGANVGTYTVLAGKVIGANVISIEPVPKTFAHLETNIAINQIAERVQLHCCGIASSRSEKMINFIADRDTCNQVAPPDYPGECVSVPMTSLDELIQSEKSTFWKIDVEGFEDHVLQGASNALDDENLQVIEIEGNSPMVRSLLRIKGFKLYHYEPIQRKLCECDTSRSGHNFLWIRDKEFALNRIRSAKHYQVNGVSF